MIRILEKQNIVLSFFFSLIALSIIASCASQIYWDVPSNSPKGSLARITFDKRNKDALTLLSIDQKKFTEKHNSPFFISTGEHHFEFTFHIVHTERNLKNPFTMDFFRESVTDIKTTTVVNRSIKPVFIKLDAKSGHAYRVYLDTKPSFDTKPSTPTSIMQAVYGPFSLSASVIIFDESGRKQVAHSEIEVETVTR